MAIPTYDRFIEPLLRFLGSRPDGASTSEVYPAVADVIGLTEAERDARLPSGRQAVYQNRIGWAQDRLKRARLSQSPKRGVWQLTETGRAFLADHPEPLSELETKPLAKPPADSRAAASDESEDSPPNDVGTEGSPDERIEQAIGELNDSLASDLLDIIGRSSPWFFEHLVLDSVVLINGSRLTRLMIEHGVGVTHRPINVAHIDSDYFEELG